MAWNYLCIPKLQRLHPWSLGLYKRFHTKLYIGCGCLSMLGSKLIRVGKRGSLSLGFVIMNINGQSTIARKLHHIGILAEAVHHQLTSIPIWRLPSHMEKSNQPKRRWSIHHGEAWVNSSPRWTKWPSFLQTTFFNCIFLNENDRIPFQISLEYVSQESNWQGASIGLGKAWRQTCDKPLPEPMLTKFTHTYMRH